MSAVVSRAPRWSIDVATHQPKHVEEAGTTGPTYTFSTVRRRSRDDARGDQQKGGLARIARNIHASHAVRRRPLTTC